MTETAWFWIGAVGMTLGAVVILATSKARTQDEEGHRIVHVIVPIVAACSYLAMAFGQGGIQLGERTFWYARYLDWSVTTPLLLLALSITALHGAHRRPALVAAVLGADVLMVAAGLISGLSEDPTHRWTWFGVSCGAFLAVYAALFGPLRAEALRRDSERRRSFARSASLLAALWLVYPVLVGLGPDGTGTITAVTTTAAITVLDFCAKVPYGLIEASGSRKIAAADLARVEVTPLPHRAYEPRRGATPQTPPQPVPPRP